MTQFIMKKNILDKKVIFVFGAAGFIGFHLSKYLLFHFKNYIIYGIDNLNNYYFINLKKYRLNILKENNSFHFIHGDIQNKHLIETIFKKYKPNIVINLAAQAGVRYSIACPSSYIKSNVVGFYNILEACRHSYEYGYGVEHFIYASSSSVYGSCNKLTFSTEEKINTPESLYAATKISNELFAYTYSKLYGMPTTGLRFFTVYGPAGRPDMAYFKFANQIMKGEPIELYNYGKNVRDFTYIEDVVQCIIAVLQKIPEKSDNCIPYKIYNIGNSHPEDILTFINILEESMKESGMNFKPIKKILLPMQPGDVLRTCADMTVFRKDFGFEPSTSLKYGLKSFCDWYSQYYNSKMFRRFVNEK